MASRGGQTRGSHALCSASKNFLTIEGLQALNRYGGDSACSGFPADRLQSAACRLVRANARRCLAMVTHGVASTRPPARRAGACGGWRVSVWSAQRPVIRLCPRLSRA